MNEITFIINYYDYFIEFTEKNNEKVVCNIDMTSGDFVYRNHIFNMESDIEKTLEYEFNERFVDTTIRED